MQTRSRCSSPRTGATSSQVLQSTAWCSIFRQQTQHRVSCVCTGPQYKGADYFYVIVDLQAYYLADGVYKSCYRAGTVTRMT